MKPKQPIIDPEAIKETGLKVKDSITEGVKALSEKLPPLPSAEPVKEAGLRVKDSITEGVKAFSEKLPILSEKQPALSSAEPVKETKPQSRPKKNTNSKKAAKKRILKIWQTVAASLAGLFIAAAGGWFLLDLTGNSPVDIRSGWVAMLGAAALVWTLSGRLIAFKLGAALLGAAVFIRDNGWLGGVLENITVVQMLCLILPLVVLLTGVLIFIKIKRGVNRGWFTFRKACSKQAENIRQKFDSIQKGKSK